MFNANKLLISKNIHILTHRCRAIPFTWFCQFTAQFQYSFYCKSNKIVLVGTDYQPAEDEIAMLNCKSAPAQVALANSM
jgi:hypothetical protein